MSAGDRFASAYSLPAWRLDIANKKSTVMGYTSPLREIPEITPCDSPRHEALYGVERLGRSPPWRG
jgi:hypothetical protein